MNYENSIGGTPFGSRYHGSLRATGAKVLGDYLGPPGKDSILTK